MSSNNNALAVIQEQYKNCNLLMPVAAEIQMNPYYKYTVMEVKADVSGATGDIYKVGSIQTSYDKKTQKATYADVFSPAKPLLMKLAQAAGIQFDPNNTYGTYINKNCYRAKAYGAMRMPDGSWRAHADEKTINLEDEEDRLRFEFKDKSIHGIVEWKAASEAAKLFDGEWRPTGKTNDHGYPEKIFIIAEKDREEYIERSVMANMMLLRKTFTEKAMTGAILRVIRALIGLKGTYTMEELQKPFAIPRVTFSPDYSDPEVRRTMLDQGLASMGNIFGGRSPALQSGAEAPIIDAPFHPETDAENPAFASDHVEDPADDFSTPEQPAPADTSPAENPNECSDCHTGISDSVAEYSKKNLGKTLCVMCQHKVKGA